MTATSNLHAHTIQSLEADLATANLAAAAAEEECVAYQSTVDRAHRALESSEQEKALLLSTLADIESEAAESAAQLAIAHAQEIQPLHLEIDRLQTLGEARHQEVCERYVTTSTMKIFGLAMEGLVLAASNPVRFFFFVHP